MGVPPLSSFFLGLPPVVSPIKPPLFSFFPYRWCFSLGSKAVNDSPLKDFSSPLTRIFFLLHPRCTFSLEYDFSQFSQLFFLHSSTKKTRRDVIPSLPALTFFPDCGLPTSLFSQGGHFSPPHAITRFTPPPFPSRNPCSPACFTPLDDSQKTFSFHLFVRMKRFLPLSGL